jgi:sugar phosphate isomerase/epimerase
MTTPSISIFSKHLHWLDLENMAIQSARMGFDGVDLTVRPGGHVHPEMVEDDLPKTAELCSNAGVDITMICTSIQDVSQPTTEKIIKTASQLGINYYRMDWYHYDRSITIENNLENFYLKMKDLTDLNEHYQIKGSYQNHDGKWFGAQVWDLGIIVKKIDSEWFGVQYDILNANIEGTKSWPIGLEWIAPYIHTIDIKDGNWFKKDTEWIVKYLPIGEGNVDFQQFIRLLKNFKIDVPFSMHFEQELGGADTGARQLTIPAEKVIYAMANDLKTFKNYLSSI